MFFNDIDILVVRQQQRDRLQEAARERLIREVQYSNQPRSIQNRSGWVDRLLLKPKYSGYLDWEKSQTI